MSHRILFDKTLQLNERRLYMVHHRQNGNYNKESSIYVSQLNPRCTEEEIVEELNLILRDDRLKKKRQFGMNHFILSAIVSVIQILLILQVLVDKEKKYSKRFAFVDFNCKEAADLCIEAWNNNHMKQYPNKLAVSMYDSESRKEAKNRDRSTSSPKRCFTNLWVDKLPHSFTE